MARRRLSMRREAPSGPAVPERLQRCEVEDWVDSEDLGRILTDLAGTTVDGHPAIDDLAAVSDAVKITAWQRHRRARRDWAKDRGLTDADLARLCPLGKPVFRDAAAFAATSVAAVVARRSRGTP